MDPGTRFGRYQLLLQMASGGMGSLHLARLDGPGDFEKLVVLKKIHPHLAENEELIRMFLDEARIAALIHHPNVAAIYELGELHGTRFIAMEYVHGHNLKEVQTAAVVEDVPLSPALVARIVADAAAGLHAAHELRRPDGRFLGVIHRDVSPPNLLVSYDGHVKVVDFGVAYATERQTQTGVGILKGKVAYMSPEQVCQQPIDRRSDIFSLGIVFYELLSGQRLFRAATEVDTIVKIQQAVVPDPNESIPGLPVGLAPILRRALAKDPEERYPTAAALQSDLEQFLVSQGRVVSHQQLAEHMEKLFGARRQRRERRIEQELKRAAAEPVQAAVVAAQPMTPVTAVAPLTLWQSMARHPGRWLAVGGLVAALAALVLVRWPAGDPVREAVGHLSETHQLPPSADRQVHVDLRAANPGAPTQPKARPRLPPRERPAKRPSARRRPATRAGRRAGGRRRRAPVRRPRARPRPRAAAGWKALPD